MGVFSLLKPKRKPAAPIEPTPIMVEPDPIEIEPPPIELEPEADGSGSTYQALTVARFAADEPVGLLNVPDLYAILGVDPLASDEVIRYAYRRKASRLHERRWRPDQAVRQLAELNAAYEILGKPDRRADYDRRRLHRAMYERSRNGESGGSRARNGRGLPSGQRHQRRRLRLGRPGGLIEVLVIVTVIVLALSVAATVLSTRSLVDLSGIVEVGETLGLPMKRRGTPAPSTTPVPTGAGAWVVAARGEATVSFDVAGVGG